MKRYSTVCLAVLLGSVLAWTASAQAPRDRGEAASESLAAWPWREELTIPEGDNKRLFAFNVPPGVFDKARQDLADLRIADANGKRIPYALRVRRNEEQQVPVKKQRVFSKTTNAEGRYAEWRLAFADDGPVMHNAVAIATAGMNFRREVRIYGSDSEQLDKAGEIAKGYIVRYQVEGKIIDLRTVHYGLSRFHYLKVRVYADLSTREGPPQIDDVIARRTRRVKGIDEEFPIHLGQREDVPGDGGPGSAWMIELPGHENVPWERLSFDVMENSFVRPYRLEVANPDEPRRVIVRGDWRRGIASEAGQEAASKPLVIELPKEVFARRLRLVVTDFSNPPLTVTNARSIIPARQVVFELPRAKQYARPLRLYFGNPKATPANYDFARTLEARPQQQYAPATLSGQVERNPAYQPPPLPLSERWPWLIYLVLGAASLVLLGILAVLARQVMARHDAEQRVG